MIPNTGERKVWSSHLALGILALVMALGITASAAFAEFPTNKTAGSAALRTDGRQTDKGKRQEWLPAAAPDDCTVTGSIALTDPTHYPVIDTDFIPDVCGGANPCPGEFLDTTNYDTYTFTNSTSSTQCVTVTLDATGCAGNFLFSVAYLGVFDPGALCQNFLGALDVGTDTTRSYGFTIPANASFQVVVEPLYGGDTCASYSLTASGTGISCGTGSATPTTTATAVTGTSTSVPTITATTTATPAVTQTATITATLTSTNTPMPPTATTCPIQFADVPLDNTFYEYIRCLACRGIVDGYSDHTFRPGNNVTRAQLSKIISNAAGFNDPQIVQMFEDVAVGSTFFDYIGRLASRGYIEGYPCGGPGEPCGTGNLPYFRPSSNATRGQISKIDSNAAGFSEVPVGQQFEDVAAGSTYYTYTYRLVTRTIMSGYPCGGPGEPCGIGNLPYFRPSSNATRGQTSKIVANTFYPNCDTPGGSKK